mgnify:CR=1 FL=1
MPVNAIYSNESWESSFLIVLPLYLKNDEMVIDNTNM